ncbi:MAG: putative lipase [Symbiobacteriaceae bacterium]|jgi:pimeloyl-ACP methyl ester carboxylesterase|nr:putative lipase [Symbiobacteriaceae bacterium]
MGVLVVRQRIAIWLGVLLVLVMALAPAAQAKGPVKAPPAPTLDGTGGDLSIMGGSSAQGTPGEIYYGALPPNVSYTKPVLVFVHGYNSSAHTWWQETAYHGVNDMYTYAYNNGYRTAFVNLHPDRNMWTNGSLLNSLIDQIRTKYGVSKVTIVAHSKGGVDSNAASVHYGARAKISRIITLGSPHKGTPLADLAYSSWAGWMVDIFGGQNEAVYSLQTGNMNYYRSITPTDTIPYYTFSGYKCGPINSAMWYGCMAISGEDDGVVPVWSTRIPGGIHLKEGYWDHDEIKMGSRTWSYFNPYIQTASLGSAVAMADGLLAAAASGPVTDAGTGREQAPGNIILRGGDTAGAGAPSFPLESGVRSASFTFISSRPDFAATLTGPDGATVTVTTPDQIPAGEIFAGAYQGTVTVAAPAAGTWNLAAEAGQKAGYLMIASLDSDLSAELALGADVVAPGASQALAVALHGPAVAASRVEAALSRSGETPHTRAPFAAAAGSARHQASVAVPAGNAIHNVTTTVTGTLADGTAFERTVVSSFAAVSPQEHGTWHGR